MSEAEFIGSGRARVGRGSSGLGAQGFGSTLGGGSFDEFVEGFGAVVPGLSLQFARSLLRLSSITDREPEQFHGGLVVGKCPRFLVILRSW